MYKDIYKVEMLRQVIPLKPVQYHVDWKDLQSSQYTMINFGMGIMTIHESFNEII